MFEFTKLVREELIPTFNPPADWENLIIPSGTQPIYYTYEHFGETHPIGEPAKIVLLWERAWFWLPNQMFCIQTLQRDNSWKNTGTVAGPLSHLYLPTINGEERVLRLMAM